jgi:hypothetical protein
VRFPKAARPATDRPVREPRAVSLAERLENCDATFVGQKLQATPAATDESVPGLALYTTACRAQAPAGLQAHPLADLFPLLEGAEFDEFVEDIRAGLNEPIIIYQDKILDGRNRYRACLAAGVEPRFLPFLGDDPVAFVISANLKRRHLGTSQRAMIAAQLANMRQGERTDLPSFEGKSVSQEQAANLLNVGVASVERARIVREQGEPALVAAVEAGKVSVSGAVEQIRRGIVTGVSMHPYAERGLDLYETPEPATRALLEVESFDGTIWECANGRNAISRVLRAAGYRVIATDLVDYGVEGAWWRRFSAVSERERLPNRRASVSFELAVGGLHYSATISQYPDGRTAEIFLANHKPGSQSDSNARDAAVAASLALQFGCPLDVLRRALLRDAQGNASTPLGAALDALADEEL